MPGVKVLSILLVLGSVLIGCAEHQDRASKDAKGHPAKIRLGSLRSGHDFKNSAEWQALSPVERAKGLKVVMDFDTIEIALDEFWKRNGHLPETLDELAPDYLTGVPEDPFATEQTRGKPARKVGLWHGCRPSKGGSGYYYYGDPKYNIWIVQTVAGGSRYRGRWISGTYLVPYIVDSPR